MPKKCRAFTLAEIMLVVICIGILTSACIFSFRRSRQSHRADTFIQEAMILRNAFMAYYETMRSMPAIALNPLTNSAFNAIRPYWYPFNPGRSALSKSGPSASDCAVWKAYTSPTLDNVYLHLQLPTGSASIDYKLVQTKLKKCFYINTSNGYCYIFKKAQ